MRVHGTAIAIAGRAALIRGPSGSGKSDLALRCITAAASPLLPARAELVADDQVELEVAGDRLLARAPQVLYGLIEIRGIGIVAAPACAAAEVALLVDLVASTDLERLPDPPPKAELAGIEFPLFRLRPFEASAAEKLLLRLLLCGKANRDAGN